MDIPCKDCISLPVCRGKILNASQEYNKIPYINSILIKCSLYNDFDIAIIDKMYSKYLNPETVYKNRDEITKQHQKAINYILKYGE